MTDAVKLAPGYSITQSLGKAARDVLVAAAAVAIAAALDYLAADGTLGLLLKDAIGRHPLAGFAVPLAQAGLVWVRDWFKHRNGGR
jgi:hypothetical protein